MAGSATPPLKQSTIYDRISNVSWGSALIVGVPMFLYSLFVDEDYTKAFLEAGVAALVVGLPLWGILSAAVYIFREPKSSSPSAVQGSSSENLEKQEKHGGC